MTHRVAAWLAAACLALWAAAGVAQTAPDYEAFDRAASSVEQAIESGTVSTFTLSGQREVLSEWRDAFMDAEGTESARVRTITAQLAALGEPPADGTEEDPRVAARRADLLDELRRLRAPGRLAEEARARASGLIAEIDGIVRDRQARRLSERGQSPLNPAIWPAAVATLLTGLGELGSEAQRALETPAERRSFTESAPAALLFSVVGLLLLVRGRHWAELLEAAGGATVTRPRRRALNFLVSLGQVALPVLGMLSIFGAVASTGVLGLRSHTIAAALPLATLYVCVARWLADRFFPLETDAASGPLELTPSGAQQLRRLSNALGWIFALHALALPFVGVAEAGPSARAVLILPFHVVEGLLLIAFGRRLTAEMHRAGAQAEDVSGFRDRVIGIFGRIVMLAGAAGPVLGALGFDAAAGFVLRPAAQTLALLGTIILLQRLVFDVYHAVSGKPEGASEGLTPVLLGFALALIGVPLLALVWGAQVSDLTEIWARFREGFDFGETRISPSDFMVFVVIFAVGYVLTRLLQGGLRNAVLPKTRLDIGGQNAIASGVGYLGIFGAALIAITAAGVNLSTLGYVAGALSVGIGFGLQNIVSNFVSGIILLIERPISQGDWIEVGGQMGYVRDISVRATRIETFDRTDVIVPNADFISGTVINWTRGNSVGRIVLPIGVAYGSDTHAVSDLLLRIAREHPMVLHNPEPYVFFKGFGDNAMEFEIRAILRDVNWILAVQTEMNHAIAKAFAEHGIEIPFPQRDLWVRSHGTLRSEADAAPGGSTAGPGGDWTDALRGDEPDIVKGRNE